MVLPIAEKYSPEIIYKLANLPEHERWGITNKIVLMTQEHEARQPGNGANQNPESETPQPGQGASSPQPAQGPTQPEQKTPPPQSVLGTLDALIDDPGQNQEQEFFQQKPVLLADASGLDGNAGQQVKNVLTTTASAASRGTAGGANIVDLAAKLDDATKAIGKRDLDFFRATGLHQPSQVGSIYNWSKIDWSKYPSKWTFEQIMAHRMSR